MEDPTTSPNRTTVSRPVSARNRFSQRTATIETKVKMPEEGGTNRPTLVRPAPDDPSKAPIENVLDLVELGVFGPVSLSKHTLIWENNH